MRHGYVSRIGMLVFLAVILFQPVAILAGEPKFYTLEDIPETSIGGVSYWDGRPGQEAWQSSKAETLSNVQGGRYDCRNKGPLNNWFQQLAQIRTGLESYLRWLNKMLTQAGRKVTEYRAKYNLAVEEGQSAAAQQAALDNWQEAERSRENIQRAIDETNHRLTMLEKKRSEKNQDITRICGGGGCPPGWAMQCR